MNKTGLQFYFAMTNEVRMFGQSYNHGIIYIYGIYILYIYMGFDKHKNGSLWWFIKISTKVWRIITTSSTSMVRIPKNDRKRLRNSYNSWNFPTRGVVSTSTRSYVPCTRGSNPWWILKSSQIRTKCAVEIAGLNQNHKQHKPIVGIYFSIFKPETCWQQTRDIMGYILRHKWSSPIGT